MLLRARGWEERVALQGRPLPAALRPLGAGGARGEPGGVRGNPGGTGGAATCPGPGPAAARAPLPPTRNNVVNFSSLMNFKVF